MRHCCTIVRRLPSVYSTLRYRVSLRPAFMQDLHLLRRSRTVRRAVAVARLQRQRLRKVLRDNVFVLVMAAACAGAASGVIAALMVTTSEALHRILFALAPGEQLSSMDQLPSANTLVALVTGGLVVGATYMLQSNRRHSIVDPIEANALHGGRMSLTDSIFVAVQSLLSSGFGLSLGIEGGFTQAAGAIGSKAGRALKGARCPC